MSKVNSHIEAPLQDWWIAFRSESSVHWMRENLELFSYSWLWSHLLLLHESISSLSASELREVDARSEHYSVSSIDVLGGWTGENISCFYFSHERSVDRANWKEEEWVDLMLTIDQVYVVLQLWKIARVTHCFFLFFIVEFTSRMHYVCMYSTQRFGSIGLTSLQSMWCVNLRESIWRVCKFEGF